MADQPNLNRWGRKEFRTQVLVKKIVARTIGVKFRDIRFLYLIIVLKPHAHSTALQPPSTPGERVIVGGEPYSADQTRILTQALDASRRGDKALQDGPA